MCAAVSQSVQAPPWSRKTFCFISPRSMDSTTSSDGTGLGRDSDGHAFYHHVVGNYILNKLWGLKIPVKKILFWFKTFGAVWIRKRLDCWILDVARGGSACACIVSRQVLCILGSGTRPTSCLKPSASFFTKVNTCLVFKLETRCLDSGYRTGWTCLSCLPTSCSYPNIRCPLVMPRTKRKFFSKSKNI